MHTIFFPREKNDKRIAINPSTARKFTELGLNILVESGVGSSLGIKDSEYIQSGAVIVSDFVHGARVADVIMRINCSSCDEISFMREGSMHISFFDRYQNPEEYAAFVSAKVHVISLEMIPRISIAQKFDVLTSQASLAGYASVLFAARELGLVFPMMVTPASTIEPVEVFVLGAGIAGLQAIATAKRLGARVAAYDVREETEEQVKSLGAKFFNIAIGQVGAHETAAGYAHALTHDKIEKQRSELLVACERADVVITTAKVFGQRAPILITQDMLNKIHTPTMFIDLSIAYGGNIEYDSTKVQQRYNEVQQSYNDNIKILGLWSAEQMVAGSASQVLAENFYNFIEHFFNRKRKCVDFISHNEILQKCLIL